MKKRLRHKWFPVNIAKLLRTAFFIEQLWWLLLNFLQNLLNITEENHFSVENFLEISQKLFLSNSCSVSKNNYFTFFPSFCFSLNMSESYIEPSQTSRWSSAKKKKFSINNFFSKCDQIRIFCRFGHIYWKNP